MKPRGGGWLEVLKKLSAHKHSTAHSYQYSFEANKKWSNFYAPSKEICEYIQGVSDKYGASRFVKLNHKVTSCVWDTSLKKW